MPSHQYECAFVRENQFELGYRAYPDFLSSTHNIVLAEKKKKNVFAKQSLYSLTMFSSKTLQVFLGIAAFAAISSPTSVLAASNSRRLKPSKSSKKSKSASLTLTTIRDINTGDTIVYGATSANPGFPSIVGLILSPDIVEADDILTVIGTTDYACTVTRSVPVLVVLCDVVACATPSDCIFVKARGEVNLIGPCPFPQSGIVFGGTGIFSGATGYFSSTSDCEVNLDSITDTTELFLDA